VPPRDRKIHVGFLSSDFNSRTIGKLTRGLITRLSRSDFHVTVFSIGHYDDPIGRQIAASADRYVVVPRDLEAARQTVLANPVDVLVFTDVGMDQTSYTLAFSRLAPVQCTTWGHPETTGLPTIDYLVSSALMEIPEADSHYSEKLVRLPSLTFYFHRADAPAEQISREQLGLDPAATLYACPQTVYKLHPDFDAALAGVLRADPRAQIVLIRWKYRFADELLRRRFARAMPDVADRIVFILRLSGAEFMSFLSLVDVMLDPFPYGGGNTTLEAFSLGVPVVTLPTGFLRGRITQAFCRRLGIDSCIAKDVPEYIEIATRLGSDKALRDETRGRILANQNRLFEDDSAVRDWEQFFRQVTATPSPSGRGQG